MATDAMKRDAGDIGRRNYQGRLRSGPAPPPRVLLVMAVLLHLAAGGAHGQTDDEELKNQVYTGLADLMVLRDEVKGRYALFCIGELDKIHDDGRDPEITKFYRLLAENAKSGFKYAASGHLPSIGIPGQYWCEFVQEKSRVKVRRGLATGPGYQLKKKGSTPIKFVLSSNVGVQFLDPFDDLVLHANYLSGLSPNDGWIESVYLQQAKFVDCEALAGGDLKSRWTWDKGQLHFDIELVQSKKLDLLPVEVKFKSRIKHFPNFFGHTRVEWKLNRKLNNQLPFRVEAAQGSLTGLGTEQTTMVFDWRIGDELEDDLFDWERKDNRIPFSNYYDFEFDVAVNERIVPGTAWEAPKGLFPDSDAMKQQ